jgi:hypothetical protein
VDSLVAPGCQKRRRNFLADFKKQIAQQACEPGVSVSRLAQQHGINANMLFKWRRAFAGGPVRYYAESPGHAAGCYCRGIGIARARGKDDTSCCCRYSWFRNIDKGTRDRKSDQSRFHAVSTHSSAIRHSWTQTVAKLGFFAISMQ